MKRRAREIAGVIGAMVLGLGLPMFGQTPVTVTLSGPGSSIPVTIGTNTEYAGVYAGTAVDASSNSYATQGLICDDFTGQVNPPQTWNALAYQASTIGVTTPLSALLYGGTLAPTYPNIGLDGYAALAYLVELSFNSTGNTTLQADIGEAIWSITDPAIAGLIDANAQALVTAAMTHAANTSNSFSAYTNLYVFVPNPLTSTYAADKQEMWGSVPVPEGGSALMYLLLAGIFCFGAVFFRSRHQVAATL